MRSSTFITHLLFFFGLSSVISALPEPVDDTTRELAARGGWDDKCWEKHGWNKCKDNHCCRDKEAVVYRVH
ncbi:hypothetical protein FRC11_004070 [Ceratobasidium sp. 423]|nr:hypothetical protein FRC11_004070 [Ceratobasidium sp. 423]